MIRRKLISKLVRDLLEENDVSSAPVDILDIATNLGLEVQEHNAPDDLSGFIQHVSDDLVVVGINRSHSKTRKRFTLAHEIGHYLLHRFDDIHLDRVFDIKLRSSLSSEGSVDEEIEANFFAAELLMPEHLLEEEIPTLQVLDTEESISELATNYGVSVQAMTLRLNYLGYQIF